MIPSDFELKKANWWIDCWLASQLPVTNYRGNFSLIGEKPPRLNLPASEFFSSYSDVKKRTQKMKKNWKRKEEKDCQLSVWWRRKSGGKLLLFLRWNHFKTKEGVVNFWVYFGLSADWEKYFFRKEKKIKTILREVYFILLVLWNSIKVREYTKRISFHNDTNNRTFSVFASLFYNILEEGGGWGGGGLWRRRKVQSENP